MQMQSVTTVRAMYPSKGVLDNGRPYDSTKVHIDTTLKDEKEGFGIPSPQYNWGTSQKYYDFISKYPQIFKENKEFEATIIFEVQTTGKSGNFVVVDIIPTNAKKSVATESLSISAKA